MFKQSSGQGTGRLGERWFQYLLPKEWIFQLPDEDIGIDGKVIIIDPNKHISGHDFDVQIKTRKDWPITDGFIKLDGLKLSTVKYWGSRLTPVMLVLYDENREIGYYSWISDTWENRNPIEYIRAQNKTITLSLDSTKVLAKQAWDTIKMDVFNYYLRIVTSYEKLNFLPFINKLTTCLWFLQEALTIESADENEKMQSQLNIVISYKLMLDTLNEIQVMYSSVHESDFSDKVKGFHNSLKADAESFIRNFGEIAEGKSAPSIVLLNDKVFRQKTPVVILKVLNFMMEITKREGILDDYFKLQSGDENNRLTTNGEKNTQSNP